MKWGRTLLAEYTSLQTRPSPTFLGNVLDLQIFFLLYTMAMSSINFSLQIPDQLKDNHLETTHCIAFSLVVEPIPDWNACVLCRASIVT